MVHSNSSNGAKKKRKEKKSMLNICDLSNALRTFSILCWKQLNSNYINKSITFPKKGQKKKNLEKCSTNISSGHL